MLTPGLKPACTVLSTACTLGSKTSLSIVARILQSGLAKERASLVRRQVHGRLIGNQSQECKVEVRW